MRLIDWLKKEGVEIVRKINLSLNYLHPTAIQRQKDYERGYNQALDKILNLQVPEQLERLDEWRLAGLLSLKFSQLLIEDLPDKNGYTKARTIAQAIYSKFGKPKIEVDEKELFRKIDDFMCEEQVLLYGEEEEMKDLAHTLAQAIEEGKVLK